MTEIPIFKRDESKDYLKILTALKELPFPVGKNLLIDFLTGDYENSSIKNNDLDSLNSFDSFDSGKEELRETIENLISKGFIEITSTSNNKFIKVLKLTPKGVNEIKNPTLCFKKIKPDLSKFETTITPEDLVIFDELKVFLQRYNNNQKKAIISSKDKILCIAGAGSGKTTVLTKRIEFLIKYRAVSGQKILAITFTRKARQEMQERLLELGVNAVVETFNSFCEKILLKNNDLIYGRKMGVINYGNKMVAMGFALNSIGITMSSAIDKYFSVSQKRNKTNEELSNILMNDCFFILDYFKIKNQEISDFSKIAEPEDKETAKMIYLLCKSLKEHLSLQGLRDYTDQILDVVKFWKKNPQFIPQFDHILVDEYQDVNAMQIELLDLLSSKNLFSVGDPRQSIFGWRGSDINYILKFPEKYPDSEIITLTKNYRSTRPIVEFMNHSIKNLGLPDLEHNHEGNKEIHIMNFDSELNEMEFILSEIISSNISREEIFVLSRTNSQLLELSKLMKQKNIAHAIKSDEIRSSYQAGEGGVTLATIHSIKGLEAKIVFIIGCNELNFPCKASDHPIIEMIKLEQYDKEEEEKRLFYVAISRAKNKLFMTYSGKKPTYFINSEMLRIINSD